MSIIAQIGFENPVSPWEWSQKEAFVMAQNLTNQEWRSIAEKASTETDSEKVTSLVAELCRSLDERQR